MIKGECEHKNLKNISGTEFRKFIFKKKFTSMQIIKCKKS